ncbi:SRPBCC domain-containing protein [Leptothermofonsia sichuanensis E412]|uniref:SRPBCC domain-containing protein n=1 Tax=Leptothermofonsia sichuanensis TaxID=2917832 RepID=UPI001CA71273|nr:SRPBCC domain-containing protein [Leptothermofonsia sichuanensis]QZZ19637.1 SRPBCC domain-containing protein [Leptothermofonsia sichuanensis E412]
MNNVTTIQDRQLTITRLFDAPRSLVFKVWTQPEHFSRWLGPKDFTTIGCQMNVQVGGMYRACIRSPEGTDYWMQGIYREIIEPERLVFTFAWEDENSQPKHETLVAVTFEEQGNKTLMTFQQAIFESIESRDSHNTGWSECFDRLATYLTAF